MTDNCIFCRIVHGAAPAFTVCADEHTVAFMDINPVTDGHTLVVTKAHFATVFEATEAALQAVAATARRVAHALQTVLQPEGLMVFQLNGAAAGQTVFHYHMHLMPRAANEPLALHTRVPGNPDRLRYLADALTAELRRVSA
jgi:histidine triad (HIT) family protein